MDNRLCDEQTTSQMQGLRFANSPRPTATAPELEYMLEGVQRTRPTRMTPICYPDRRMGPTYVTAKETTATVGLLLALVAGCTTEPSAGTTGDDSGETDGADLDGDGDPVDVPALPPFEPVEYCPELELAPLAVIATDASAGQIAHGPCGHAIYSVSEDRKLYTPGAGTEAIDAELWRRVEFAPSANFVTWEVGDTLVLRDLIEGERQEFPAPETYGFVAVPASEHGSELWTCAGGVLALAGPVNAAIIAEGVECATVVGSRGAPRVAFVAEDQVLWADVEDGTSSRLDVDDWTHDDVNEDETPRRDRLRIDYDGAVVVHEVIEGQLVGVGLSFTLAEARILEVGQTGYETWTPAELYYDRYLVQAPVRGAPLILLADDSMAVWADGQLSEFIGAHRLEATDARGWVTLNDQSAGRLVRVRADGSFEVILDDVSTRGARASRAGDWMAVHPAAEGCQDISPCTQLRLWHEGEGLTPALVSGGDHTAIDISEGGTHVLTHTTNVSEFELLDADLELVVSHSIDTGAAHTIRLETYPKLEDGRMLLYSTWNGAGALGEAFVVVDPAAGTIEEAPEFLGIFDYTLHVDLRRRHLTFMRDVDGVRELLAGTLP